MTYNYVSIYGDSYGVGVGSILTGATITAKVGISMYAILESIQKSTEALVGRTVILSTGTLNSFAPVDVFADNMKFSDLQLAVLHAQIDAILVHGAMLKNICVVGCGKPNADTFLAPLYAARGICFLPVNPASLGHDHLHPSDWSPVALAAIA